MAVDELPTPMYAIEQSGLLSEAKAQGILILRSVPQTRVAYRTIASYMREADDHDALVKTIEIQSVSVNIVGLLRFLSRAKA